MEKPYLDRAAAAPHPNRRAVWVVVLCVCLAVSMALLGGSLGRFIGGEPNVIPLLPPAQTQPTGGHAAPKRSTDYTPAAPRTPHAELQVTDAVQAWRSETHVDLFQESYDETVNSENGERVIAPGTSHLYGFTVKNNGDVPLDYALSLEVDTWLGDGDYPPLPLEWRLLTGGGDAVTDWENYNDRTEVLRQATLRPRSRDGYTIEWRWLYERGMDAADTETGNLAAGQPLGAKATIYIYAEQSAADVPQTGDDFDVILYAVVLAVSACGLLLLLAVGRKRRKNRENDRKES